jgi:hypothetical protein
VAWRFNGINSIHQKVHKDLVKQAAIAFDHRQIAIGFDHLNLWLASATIQPILQNHQSAIDIFVDICCLQRCLIKMGKGTQGSHNIANANSPIFHGFQQLSENPLGHS